MNFFQKTDSLSKDKLEFRFYRWKVMHFLAIKNQHLLFIHEGME